MQSSTGSKGKRYYWLKLHEEFFSTSVMKYIRKLPDGDKITIIYLKLLLVSLRSDGYIYLEGLYPTMEEEIALLLDEEVMCVQFSLAALEKVKLLERGSGEYELYLTRFPEMIGICSEGASAARMRALRERNQLAAAASQMSLSAVSPSQSDIEVTTKVTSGDAQVTGRDASVRFCDGEEEKEKKKDPDTEKEADDGFVRKYGVGKNVLLTEAEYESLKRQFPDYLGKIDYLSSYMTATGRNYDHHYMTILQWAKQDELKRPHPAAKKPAFEDYSFRKGESY